MHSRMGLTAGNGGYIFPHVPMTPDQSPITKADLVEFVTSLAKTLETALIERLEASLTLKVETALGSILRRIEKLEKDIDRVLTVLINMDERLKARIGDHEQRIRRLEEAYGVAVA